MHLKMNKYKGICFSDLTASFALFLFLVGACLSLLSYLGVAQAQAEASDFTFEVPKVALAGVPFEQTIQATEAPAGPLELRVGDETYMVEPQTFGAAEEGIVSEATVEDIVVPGTGEFTMTLSREGQVLSEGTSDAIYGWLSVLPALIAIAMALLTRQVVPSLFLGVAMGAWMTYGLSVPGLWFGLLDTMQVYVLEALVPPDGDKGHISIVIFTLMMGGAHRHYLPQRRRTRYRGAHQPTRQQPPPGSALDQRLGLRHLF